MMRPLYALVATLGLVLLAAPVSASTAPDSAGTCMPSPCETVNSLCRKAFDVDCVALRSLGSGESGLAAEDCMGAVCDAINGVCQRVGGNDCVGLAATAEDESIPTPRCAGLPCDVVNLACTIVKGGPCVR